MNYFQSAELFSSFEVTIFLITTCTTTVALRRGKKWRWEQEVWPVNALYY